MNIVLRSLRFVALTAIVFVVLTVSFIFFYSDHIKNILINELKLQIKEDVTVQLENINLTWFTHFPDISLQLDDLKIYQKTELTVDTLISVKELGLGLDISELLQNDFTIEKIFIANGSCGMKIDTENNNFNIFKPRLKKDSLDTKIAFELEEVHLENFSYSYSDISKGDLYSVSFEETTATVMFENKNWNIDLAGPLSINDITTSNTNYLKDKRIDSQIYLKYQPEKKQFILDNSYITINEAQFELEGAYTNNLAKNLNLKISAKEGKISNVTSLLPNSFGQIFKSYQTKGNIYFSGQVFGNLSEGAPSINVNFGFNKTSFSDPNTNQNISNATLQGSFSNGKNKDNSSSTLEIKTLSFEIEKKQSSGRLKLSNFNNPSLELNLDLNIPFKSIVKLSGLHKIEKAKGFIAGKIKLKASIDALLKNSKNNNLISSGNIDIKNVSFDVKGAELPCSNINGKLLLNKSDLGVINFRGKTGNSDFKINGVAINFIPFLIEGKKRIIIQGGFNSQHIDLDQLLSQSNEIPTENLSNEGPYNFKISKLLSFDLNCEVDNLKFRRLKEKDALKNITGQLHLKDQLFEYKNVTFNLAGGKFKNNGTINAQKENLVLVDNKSSLENLDVRNFFYVFEDFNQTFITEKNLKGKMNGSYNFKLNFDQKLRLDYKEIMVSTDLKITNGELINFAPLMEMKTYLTKKKYEKFVQNSDLSKVVFSELKSKIWIENNTIYIPKSRIKNSVAQIAISGTHTFDNKIDYTLDFPLVNYKKQSGNNINEDKYLNIIMGIKGTTDDYNLEFKTTDIIRDFGGVIKESVNSGGSNDNPDYIGIDDSAPEDDDDWIEIE